MNFSSLFLIGCGYFIDIFDLVLFSTLRISSFEELKITDPTYWTVVFFNLQMTGILVGGIFWGKMADIKGRSWSFMGTILVFSIANIINGLTSSLTVYGICRFIAGFGLAGEMGSGIALICEKVPDEKRSLYLGFVSSLGCIGAVLSGWLGDIVYWRYLFIGSGFAGILLTLLRKNLLEPDLFRKTATLNIPRGQWKTLFQSPPDLIRFILLIFLGIPMWYIIGILWSFSTEMTSTIGLNIFTSGQAILWGYVGVWMGDMLMPFVSQFLKSRIFTIQICLIMMLLGVIYLFQFQPHSLLSFQLTHIFLGFTIGYWAVYATLCGESFGTNIRALTSTSLPSLIRFSSIPMMIIYQYGRDENELNIALGMGLTVLCISMITTYFIKDTFQKDIDFQT
jgi:MFS transporter, putative metabolite:H+ symporter